MSNPFYKQNPPKAREPLGEETFKELYAAAAFAEEFGLPMDTMVTINWRLLGVEADAARYFSTFTAALRHWLDKHYTPHAWIYGHEVSATAGLHTHLAVFLMTKQDRSDFRKRFLRDWQKNQFGRRVAKAVKATGPSSVTLWQHWRAFSYIAKSLDPHVVLRGGRETEGGKVLLGDLIAYDHKESGPVPLKRQIGWSESLSATWRASGIPSNVQTKPHPGLIYNPFDHTQQAERPSWWKPFRSKFDDGVRDVRKLYPPEFLEQIPGRARALKPAQPAPCIEEETKGTVEEQPNEAENMSGLEPSLSSIREALCLVQEMVAALLDMQEAGANAEYTCDMLEGLHGRSLRDL